MTTRPYRLSREVPDWLAPRLRRMAGPSWLMSAVVHLLAAFAIWTLAQSPGCQAVRGEQASDQGREVGIFVRPPGPETPPAAASDQAAISQPQDRQDATASSAVPSAPPVGLRLPNAASPNVIGLGAPPSAAVSATAQTGTALVAQGSTAADAGPPEASFLGISAKGKRFVYVIDRSASMDVALRAAKGELLASIQRLDQNQLFQIVFFNSQPESLRNRFGMFHGTESERLLVKQQLQEYSAEGGTERLAALEMALKFNPDVIYFLTDSSEPMSPRDLEDVRRRNRGGAQIHCVEFGESAAPTDAAGKPIPNFLMRLSEMTNGRYVYWRVE